jgi:hypothetical protein
MACILGNRRQNVKESLRLAVSKFARERLVADNYVFLLGNQELRKGKPDIGIFLVPDFLIS